MVYDFLMLTGTQFYSASVLTLCGINTSTFIHQKSTRRTELSSWQMCTREIDTSHHIELYIAPRNFIVASSLQQLREKNFYVWPP